LPEERSSDLINFFRDCFWSQVDRHLIYGGVIQA
jgi:hypothetical protein